MLKNRLGYLTSRYRPSNINISSLARSFSTDVVLEDEDIETAGRVVRTMKKHVKGSPQKFNMLTKQIRGLAAEEALLQMKFSKKTMAREVHKTLQNAVNLADIKYEILPKNLKVSQAFVGKGQVMKRIRYHGKGQHGRVLKKSTHITIELEEVPEIEPKSYYGRYPEWVQKKKQEKVAGSTVNTEAMK